MSELIAQHEAQRQEDQLALQEKEKRINELEEALLSRAQIEEHLEEQRKVGVVSGCGEEEEERGREGERDREGKELVSVFM